MKATIDVKGCLTLRPESSVEAYALKHWSSAHFERHLMLEDFARTKGLHLSLPTTTILVDVQWPPIDKEPKP